MMAFSKEGLMMGGRMDGRTDGWAYKPMDMWMEIIYSLSSEPLPLA